DHVLTDGVDGGDVQGEQDGVGVGGLDGAGDGGAAFRLEAHVPADELDLVADALEEEDPLAVGVEGFAAHAESVGDGDGAEERLVELVAADLHEDGVVAGVEVEEAFQLTGALDDPVEVLELFFRGLAGGGFAVEVIEGEQAAQEKEDGAEGEESCA